MSRARAAALWLALAAAILVPLAFAATSPLLAWRQPVYIAAGFAGVMALGLLLLQPVLMAGLLPGLGTLQSRSLHRVTGGLLVAAIIVHVVGLWISSPPDVIDALLLQSPTPFSVWGVLAMWAVFLVAGLALARRRIRPRTWRAVHLLLAAVIVTGSVVHALLIEGTMEMVSKSVLCALLVAATLKVVAARLRPPPAPR